MNVELGSAEVLLMTQNIEDVPGFKELTNWFGSFPTFHDAEVTSIHLDRSKQSRISIHAFEEIDEWDAKGYCICRKHAVITFVLEDILAAAFQGFNGQNVLSGLSFERTAEGFRLVLE